MGNGLILHGEIRDAAIGHDRQLQIASLVSLGRHQEDDARGALARLEGGVVENNGHFRRSGGLAPALGSEGRSAAGRGNRVRSDDSLTTDRFDSDTANGHRFLRRVVERDVDGGDHRIVVQNYAALARSRISFVDGRHVGVAHIGGDVAVLGGGQGEVDGPGVSRDVCASDVIAGIDAIEIVHQVLAPGQEGTSGSDFAHALLPLLVDVHDVVGLGVRFGVGTAAVLVMDIHDHANRILVHPVNALAAIDDLAGVGSLRAGGNIRRGAERHRLAGAVAHEELVAGDKGQHGQCCRDDGSDFHT